MAYLYKGRKQEKKFNAKTSKLPDARIILRYLGAGFVIVFLSDRLGRCCGARFKGQLRGEFEANSLQCCYYESSYCTNQPKRSS